MTSHSPCVGSQVAFARGAFVRGLRGWAFVRDQAGGALSSAAVPRVCLEQTAPLCRCAKCTTDLILRVWWAFHRWAGLVLAAWWTFHRWCRHHLPSDAGIASTQTHTAGCPGAWLGRRSGIKEEAAALGRNGGQLRSQVHRRPDPRTKRSALPTRSRPKAQRLPAHLDHPRTTRFGHLSFVQLAYKLSEWSAIVKPLALATACWRFSISAS